MKLTSINKRKIKKIGNFIIASNIALSIIPNTKGYSNNDVKNFIDNGKSNYGYIDLQLRSNYNNKKKLYDDLYKIYYDFALSDKDASNIIKSLHIEDYNLNKDQIIEAYYTFSNDHPELYFIDKPSITNGLINLHINMFFAKAEVRKKYNEAIQTTVNGIVDKANKCDSLYDKVLSVHHSIANITSYSKKNGEPCLTVFTNNIVGPLDGDENTKSVCEGYAKAFQLLMNCLKINNVYVCGWVTEDNQRYLHAWNLVEMEDGIYYRVDVTKDDNGWISFKYFLIETESTNQVKIERGPDKNGFLFQYELPKSTNLNYSDKRLILKNNKN